MTRPFRYFFGIIRAALGLTLLYYVLSATGGWSAARQLFATAWLLPALSALTFLGAAIEAKRLCFLFRSQALRLGFGQAYRAVAIGTLFNSFIPGATGGDVVKLYYLALDHRGRRIEVATLLFVDRAVALFALLLLIVALAVIDIELTLANPLIGGLVATAILGMLGLLLGGAIAWSPRLRASSWYNYLMTKLPLHRYLRRVSDALYAFRTHKMALLQAASLSLVGHIALAGMLIAAGRVLMPAAPGGAVSLLAMLGLLANALPITPGGLGVGEAAFEGLFRSAGYAGGAQLMLAWRAGMLAMCVIGFVLYVAGAPRSQRQVEEPGEATTLAPAP